MNLKVAAALLFDSKDRYAIGQPLQSTRALLWALPRLIAPLTVVAMIFLVGCGVHLHRPDDAQLARGAATAFQDSKLTEAVKAEFDAAAKMLDDEVAAVRRQSNARRDRLLANIIAGTTAEDSWGRIANYAEKRLEDLFGHALAAAEVVELDRWIVARENSASRFQTVRQAYLVYEQLRVATEPPIPRIGARLAEEPASKLTEPLKTVYRDYTAALAKYEAESRNADTPPQIKGLVGAAVSGRDEQKRRLKEASDAGKTAKKMLDAVNKEREDKIAEAGLPGKRADEISKALRDAADKTDAATKMLKGLLNEASKGGLVGVQETIIALEEVRTQVAALLPVAADAVAGKKLPAGDSEKIRLLASITAIRVAVDGAAYPRVSDLVLESERLRIELDRLRGMIALEEERGTLLDLQLTAFAREIVALRFAKQRAESARPWGVLALESALTKQEAMADALAYTAESWSVGRTSVEEIDFLIYGIDHRMALENSSAAFAQWSNLIGVPLAQLVAYHASGIKAEDLANLINAAGLSAIAARIP